MLDIDHFKRINNTNGHLAGDMVLREVARILRDTLRDEDTAARYGGEELVILLPGASLQAAFNTAEELRKRIEDLCFSTDQSERLFVTASFGCAAFKDLGTEEHLEGGAFVAAADACMYQAKNAGRNQVACTICIVD